MFSGIVEETGKVAEVRRGRESLVLTIRARLALEGTRVGDSIAVNGVCLTVRALQGDAFTADVMAQTVRATTLGELRPGDPVNLERALRLGDRLGGHLVTGHVDGVGRILRREPRENSTLLEISLPPELAPYLVPKGSVAVDGVSLTVAALRPASFEVALIPHTAAVTTLGRRRPGDRVNLEADLFGKYVARLWEAAGLPRPGAPGAEAHPARRWSATDTEEGE